MARSNATAKIREIAESSSDPRKALLSALGSLRDETVCHSQVLVATYIQPARTKGGVYIPDKSLDEDRFQGTTGLVVAVGPGAFKDDNIAKFHGVEVKVGDWVLYRPSDGTEMFIRSVPCRLFQDVDIRMIVSDPSIYW